ncbi:MAG TPA: TonB-dependent receptor [Steroidobacteraceae bacterium]|jgi:iron complex outermembrane recepter protein|nr:TonB-dependent receptor [Steroidobacteraceae bacterium]
MKRRALLTLSVATTLGWSHAHAQEAANSQTLEEIVVTARQRAEKIEDVPATIQAFTARDIAIAGIERPTDFIALTPGLAQVQTAEVGDLQLSIRGLNTGRDAETNFALVIDGVLQTNPTAFNQELANVQQIEVLKGPQGAIYGRNAVAGAIIVTTRKPGQGFEGDVDVGVGNNNAKKAHVYLGGGSEAAQFGVGGFYRETDGFFENSFLGCDDCVDYYKEYGVTPRLVMPMGDNGELDVKAKYSKLEAGAINFNATFALPFFATFTNNPDFFQDVNDHEFNYISNIVPVNEQENKQISVKGEWTLDVGTLTAWVAYNDQTNFFLTDGTSAAFGLYARTSECQADIAAQVGGPLPSPTFYAGANSVLPPYSPSRCDGYQYQQRDQQDTSLEIRLASPANQAFRWLAGVYYADIDRRVVVSQGGDRGLGFQQQAFVPSTGPNPTDLLYDDDLNSKVSAVFGQIAYDVTEGMELALALRYDSEKRSVDNNVPTGAQALAQTPLFGPGPTAPFINPAYTVNPALATSGIPNRDETFEQLQPKVSLNWKFAEDWAAFASYGYGFRSGGFNSTGSNATIQTFLGGLRYVAPDGTVTTTPSLVTQGISYDDYKKEVAKAAEIGLKAELLDRTLSLNLAAYHTKVEDMQIFNFLAGPFGLLRVVTNVDEATLQGVEADLRWRANQYVNLFAGVGLLDSEIDKYDGRPYTKGNKVPYAPDYTATAGVDFVVPIGDSGLSLVARLDASFTGETWFSAVQDDSVTTEFGVPGDYSKTSRDAFSVVNARLGISADKWEVTAWARNLTDEEYLAEVIPAPEFGGTFSHEAPGMAIGLDLKYSFGK